MVLDVVITSKWKGKVEEPRCTVNSPVPVLPGNQVVNKELQTRKATSAVVSSPLNAGSGVGFQSLGWHFLGGPVPTGGKRTPCPQVPGFCSFLLELMKVR